MKFYYGVSAINIEVTDYVLSNLVKNNIIMIPTGDLNRGSLFTDPIVGIHKFFIIKDEFNNNTSYDEYINVYIDTTNNSVYTSKMNVPQYIMDIYPLSSKEKLLNIHTKLKIDFGSLKDEFPEQLMATTYLKGDEKILEIGGNIGRNSLVIASILNDDTQLVSLECDSNIAQKLVHNRDLNNMHFFIESSALSKRKLIQQGWDTIASDVLLDGYKEVNSITWVELNNKYNIDFDTLVLDCEGAFYYILQDMPEVLNNIKLIIMENDYHVLENKQYVDKVLTEQGFIRDYFEAGGWGPCYNNFFEVWVNPLLAKVEQNAIPLVGIGK
jgi:FkbM family methyltransferase